jgi:cardiolipin synthase
VWRGRSLTGARMQTPHPTDQPPPLTMNLFPPTRIALLGLAMAAAGLPLAACRSPRPQPLEPTHQWRTLQRDGVTAVKSGRLMAFKFRVDGRDSHATAALPAGGPDLQAALVMHAEASAAFLAGDREHLRVLGTDAWRRLTRDLCAELAPQSPGHATLVTVADRELVIGRDTTGEPGFYPLTQRPPGVSIQRRICSAELVHRMAASFKARHGSGAAILLTGAEPPLLLLDPAVPQLLFINTPAQECTELPLLGSSPDVTARGLLSLGLRSGVLHTVKNPASTAMQAAANLLTAATAAARSPLAGLPDSPPPPVNQGTPMDRVDWERHLDRITGTVALPSTVKLHIGGSRFFPEFIQAVQEARESIDILCYIWDTDDYAIQMADLLRKRSHEVKVRILVDEAASFHSALMSPESPQLPGHRAPSCISAHLRRDSSIEVRPMAMSALTANHSKMVIIDGQRAWLGGMNIGREYRVDWHDLMAEVRGPLIGWMQRMYATTWTHQGLGGDVAAMLAEARADHGAAKETSAVPPGAYPVRPMRNSAVHRGLCRSQIEALRRARHTVWLQNAYITDLQYIRELILARHRGVDVRVIMPEENDIVLLKASNRALVDLLLRHGIRVYLLPGMSHAKAALYDGWATLGSANYDRLSLRVNTEFNIAYSHPPAVEELRRDLFLKDMARSREVTTPAHPSPSTSRRLRDNLLRLVAGQL